MLAHKEAMATVAVTDIDVAKKFYGDTLGLESVESGEPEVAVYRTGGSKLLVYPSRYAGSNEATAVTWTVGADLEKIVRALKAKGVRFEHYELPGTTLQDDVHVSGSRKVAWFKDPDGNIHALASD